MVHRQVAGSSAGAGHHGADVACKHPCHQDESAALRIGASRGLDLAGEPLVAGLGIQGGSPLVRQLLGHEWMEHCPSPQLRVVLNVFTVMGWLA